MVGPAELAALGSLLQAQGTDAVIAHIAARQRRVVARRQLIAAGIGSRAIAHRLGRARLHRAHRGVYAVGCPVQTVEEGWMAAVLVGGDRAALSHRAATAHWGLRPVFGGPVEIVGGRPGRAHRGVLVHWTEPRDDEVTVHEGIPVTTVARTILDLAAVSPAWQVEQAIARAESLRLWDSASLAELVDRHPRSRGAGVLRAALGNGPSGATRSALEDRFLSLTRRQGLPRPEVNVHVPAGGHLLECDFVWRRQGVVVEADSHSFHRDRKAFEGDRRRDRLLQAAGWRVVRVTWAQLRDEPEAVAGDLRVLLA